MAPSQVQCVILYNLRCAVSSRSFQDCKASLPKEGPDAEAGSTYSSFKVCLPRSCFSCLHSVDFSRGFYGIVMALIGDLDYMNKFLGQPHWASAANPCNLCLCTKAGPLTWKDSRPNAPWRATTYTTGSWQANPDRSKKFVLSRMRLADASTPRAVQKLTHVIKESKSTIRITSGKTRNSLRQTNHIIRCKRDSRR